MDTAKQRAFNERMGKLKRPGYSKGGTVKGRKTYASGGSILSGVGSDAAAGAAVGSVIPGIGTAVGGAIGAIGGLLGGIFGGSSPQLPNITDPVTGAQITNAQGQVVATQQQLQAFSDTLNGVNGVQNQQSVLGQFQAVASGQGPNPALAALAQQTGINVSNQAALMAGQRGASANVGLIARQAAQQGAATQQQAVGQAATTQAQQSLGALGQEATIAGQQVAETQGALTASGQQALGNAGQLLGAQTNFNQQIAGGQANVNTTQAGLAGTEANTILTGAGAVAKGLGGSTTAANTPAANSGAVTAAAPGPTASTMTNGQGLARGGEVMQGPHKSHVANFLALSKGGKVPAMVSPGEGYLSPDGVQKVLGGANPLKVMEKIPGKARVKGDSRKNDTVARTLEEGGVVLPRHITNKRDPDKASLFVHRAVHMRKPGRSAS